MTKTRKILTFCTAQVSMIALMFGFSGNQQAQGPYAKLFNNAFGVKDAEAFYHYEACGEVCVWEDPNHSFCSDALAVSSDWCGIEVGPDGPECSDGYSEDCDPTLNETPGGEDDDDES